MILPLVSIPGRACARPGPGAGRASARPALGCRRVRAARPARAAVAGLVALAATLSWPAAAHAGDDQPTQWQIDARAEMLQTAPPPAEKPVICIVDTGVTPTPDLDIVSRTALDGGNPDDVTARPGHYGHGTTVAHMAAGKVNGWGSSGVFPHARIASVRIFDELNQRVPWQRYIVALDRCVDVKPRPVVAVLSLGRPATDHDELKRLEAVIATARRNSMSVVAAAGNGGGIPDFPARFTESFSVTSGGTGGPCSFSAHDESVDVVAPDCTLRQSGWDGRIWNLEGTSYSAPIAGGALAALRAYGRNVSVAQSERALTQSFAGSVVPMLDLSRAAEALEIPALRQASADATTPGPAARSEEEIYTVPDTGRTGLLPPPFSPAVARDVSDSPPIGRSSVLPRPQVRARMLQRTTLLKFLNRPRVARAEVRVGRLRRTTAHDTITVRDAGTVRVRYLAGRTQSPWVQVARRGRRP